MKWFWIFSCLPTFVIALDYEVRFIGLADQDALETVLETSQLVSMQHRPPASINGLRYRIASDIPLLIQALHAYAYYEAEITSRIEFIENSARVDLLINPGPQFSLRSYDVYSGDCKHLAYIAHCCPLSPEQLGLKLGSPALSSGIINAELNVLHELARCGHPLAYIDKRRVEVDMSDHSVKADSCVQEGPFATFGPITYFGIQDINPRFIQRKISWKEGCTYDTDLIQETQERLLKTELFSAVFISHGDTVDEHGNLPIKMRITEAKHKKIALGAFYATINGFGGNAVWTHRNIRGMGEILSIKAEYAQRSYAGNITYKKPDFLRFDQTYKALVDMAHENIHPYHALMFRFANYIERPEPPYTFFSAGLKVDHIVVTNSATNGSYTLIGLPLFGKYEKAENPLDPKEGYTFAYSVTPYQSLLHGDIHFAKQRFTGTCYIPLFPNKRVTLALRLQAGSIAGTKQKNVPMPKLFFGGSEDELRGYKYQTVSPLRGKRPLGGRSAIFTSVELRIRLMESFGIVPFADFGTVSLSAAPQFDEKWFKSVGLGLRYFGFFGPLRFDVGFPLNRRKGIDSSFQIYASVGQSF